MTRDPDFSQIEQQIIVLLGNNLMPASQLDEFDLRILAILQEDASLSIHEIAEQVRLSQNACWRRIKRLDEEGVIRKRVRSIPCCGSKNPCSVTSRELGPEET